MELDQDGLCEPSICPVNDSTIQTLKSAVVPYLGVHDTGASAKHKAMRLNGERRVAKAPTAREILGFRDSMFSMVFLLYFNRRDFFFSFLAIYEIGTVGIPTCSGFELF